MVDEGSFDEALQGVDCVFIASLIPTYFGPSGKAAKEMEDEQGYAEIIMPTVNGCLNILRSVVRHGIKNVVICSSTSSTNPIPAVTAWASRCATFPRCSGKPLCGSKPTPLGRANNDQSWWKILSALNSPLTER